MVGGGRVFGGSNMSVILPNSGSTDALEALLISSSSPSLHGSRSMVNFEEISGKKLERSFYQPHDQDETCDGDFDECFHQPEKKRRLTADQVQFLERSFDIENKLEPERKIQLARDLGLQPRQVAIWFQNRRARWKTKQLEKDYDALRASYNNLKADYEILLKEREKLKSDVILLTDKVQCKEKDLQRGKNPETFEFGKHQSDLQSQKPESNSVSAIKESYEPIMVCKQEDLSSADSAVFDSDSTHCTDGARHSSSMEPAVSSNIFEPDQSDISHTEEEEDDNLSKNLLPLVFNLPKLEDSIYGDPPVNLCNYGLPIEDHAFWFWPQ